MIVTLFGGATCRPLLRALMEACTSFGWQSQIPSQATAHRAFGKTVLAALTMFRRAVKLVL